MRPAPYPMPRASPPRRRHPRSRSRIKWLPLSAETDPAAADVARRTSPLSALADRWIPKLVLAPSIAIAVVFIYGFIVITGYLSLTKSRLLPNYTFDGFGRYTDLFQNDVWWTSAANLGWFGIPFIAICVGLGLFLAILLDQQIRHEGALRAVFLYPMALSFIVTGTAWQWILNPGLGLEKVLHDWGWTSFSLRLAGRPGARRSSAW